MSGSHVLARRIYRDMSEDLLCFRFGGGAVASTLVKLCWGPATRTILIAGDAGSIFDPGAVATTFLPEHFCGERWRGSVLSCDWMFLGHHPNLVSAHGVELLGNPAKPYLVLEGIEPASGRVLGEDVSLFKLIQNHTKFGISFSRALSLIWDVAQAMDYAWSKIPGFVHRDIKPANILIDRFGCARLTDFGIAKSFAGVEHEEAPEHDH